MARIVSKTQISAHGKRVEHLDPVSGETTKIEKFDRQDRCLEVSHVDPQSGKSTMTKQFDVVTGGVCRICFYEQGWMVRAEHYDSRTGIRTRVETFPPKPTAFDRHGPILLSRVNELEVLERLIAGNSQSRGIDAEARDVIEAVRARLYHQLKELIRDGEAHAVAKQSGVSERFARVREPLPGVGWPTSR